MITRAAVALLAPALAYAQGYGPYTQVNRYQGANFFDQFNFFTGADPTHGFVKYVDQATAKANGLISNTATTAYMGVDYTSKLAADGSKGGRQSVRLESKIQFTEGLFIMDANHMPGGICGTWPAWWTFGGDWPNNGEIDIIESVNRGTQDLASLHTSDNCKIATTGYTGKAITTNCYQYDPNQPNSGCGIQLPSTNGVGTNFNNNKGGVYAMEWTGRFIHVWFFPRGSIPSDITKGAPTPWTWGPVMARFAGGCNIVDHFKNHNMVLDTTFCGDWAGSVFAQDSVCNAKGSCQAYVANTPGDFKNAYWSINYIAVYKSKSHLYPDPVPLSAFANVRVASPAPPALSTNPAITKSIQNNAAGATGQPVASGVLVPNTNVAAKPLAQEPAVQNGTSATG